MNLVGNLFSRNILGALYQINRDLARPDLKNLLWQIRYEAILDNPRLFLLLNKINFGLKTAVVSGVPGNTSDIAYINRQGQKFHLINDNFAKGFGFGLNFDNSSKEGKLDDVELENFSISDISKSELKALRKKIRKDFLQTSQLSRSVLFICFQLNYRKILLSYKNYFKAIIILFLKKYKIDPHR
jgi:hypothetical protein